MNYAIVTARMVQGEMVIETVEYETVDVALDAFEALSKDGLVCADLVDVNDNTICEWSVK